MHWIRCVRLRDLPIAPIAAVSKRTFRTAQHSAANPLDVRRDQLHHPRVSNLAIDCDSAERRSDQRQSAVLRIALITIGQSTQFCRVVNVSQRGLEVRLFSAVPRGTRVRLQLPDTMRVSGTVVWSRDNAAGIHLDTPLDTDGALQYGAAFDPKRRRRLPRASVAACARLRVGALTYPADLQDISPAGALVHTRKPLNAAGPALLTLPDFAPIPSQVRWTDGSKVGLLFNRCLEMQALAEWINQRQRVDLGRR